MPTSAEISATSARYIAEANARRASIASAPTGANRCPKCYAAPSAPCMTRRGNGAQRLHIGRAV